MKLWNTLLSVMKSGMLWACLGLIVALTFITSVTYEATKASVQVTHNGDTQIIRTHADSVEDLLTELNVTPKAHDLISHELSAPVTYGMDVEYTASTPVNLMINDESQTLYTTADTVELFLEEQGVELKEHDVISHSQESKLIDNMEIQIDRAIAITLNDGGDEEKLWTTSATVEELLNQENITLDKLDELKLSKDEKLSNDMTVSIKRIKKVTEVVEEEIEYKVVKEKDDSLHKGEEKVLTAGEPGKVKKEYEVLIVNGEEKERKLVEEDIEKESVDEIVALGTKAEAPKRRTVAQKEDKPAIERTSAKKAEASVPIKSEPKEDSTKTFTMNATAYTADCKGCTGKTATGIDLKADPDKKVIAVDPDVIPLGSKVWVEGYGTAVAGDTGGAIEGNKIDVFVPSKSDAINYGVQTVEVKVLD
ncbi:G5 and 3D domain-containing protein [Halobacillus sp. Marseille-Q1614]|uniref:G5 and 3D domain-containing protein n=1 Tax=Halobacillus sp. Marseille-Q1614 TaxID=2709134 RepID=UPI00156EB4FE|nr:G5 and 3D domain-containing protein [Halobacillus sp. Marseille-Q1614]